MPAGTRASCVPLFAFLKNPAQYGGDSCFISGGEKMSHPTTPILMDREKDRRPRTRKKGGGLAALLSCKSRRNPIVELYQRLHLEEAGSLKPEQMIVVSENIEKTIQAGARQEQEMTAALARLRIASPQEGRDFVPLGF
jgi:hypothetical protein